MSTDRYSAAVQLESPTVPGDQSRKLRQWGIVTTLLVVILFVEAAFAGAMLSGADWARKAHALTASVLTISAVLAALFALVTLRRIPGGLRLGLALLSLAALVIAQAVVGALAAKGANLLWVHVPLGVALFGFATQAAARARGLRDN